MDTINTLTSFDEFIINGYTFLSSLFTSLCLASLVKNLRVSASESESSGHNQPPTTTTTTTSVQYTNGPSILQMFIPILVVYVIFAWVLYYIMVDCRRDSFSSVSRRHIRTRTPQRDKGKAQAQERVEVIHTDYFTSISCLLIPFA